MKRFSEIRKSLESQSRKEVEAQSAEPLHEESWLNKGFALGQYARHSSMRQQINTVLSSINSLCDRGKHEQDTAEKLDILFDVLKENARLSRGLTELSTYTINVSIASALLSEDLRKVIATEFSKFYKHK